ncbi:MAG: ribonuclease P protein component [Crocinitomicaceae bacterium]|nr:ribonuclease P protein component [Crocinitomicaceae bacterium]MDG1775833.1 ribonuclease P protein component [Crocinitomicaceae bacterium]
MNYKLGKNYKLCSKTTIQGLFDNGVSVKCYPFVALIKEVKFEDEMPFKVVFSAPKRTFRKAVQRNAIKRKSKEAFRLNKNILEQYLKENNKQIALFLVYSTLEEFDHIILQKKTKKLFDKIIKKLNEPHV